MTTVRLQTTITENFLAGQLKTDGMTTQTVLSYVVGVAVLLLAVIGFVGILSSLIGIIVNVTGVLRNVRGETRFWRDTLGNPFNMVFRPSLLTEAGLRARSRLFLWFARLLASAAATLAAFLLMQAPLAPYGVDS